MEIYYRKIPREIVKEIIDYMDRNKTLKMFFKMEITKFVEKIAKQKYKEEPIYYSKKAIIRLKILRKKLVNISYKNLPDGKTEIVCNNSFERYLVNKFCEQYNYRNKIVESNEFTKKDICPLCKAYTKMYNEIIYCKNKKCNYEIYISNDNEIKDVGQYTDSMKKVDYVLQIRSLFKKQNLKIIEIYYNK